MSRIPGLDIGRKELIWYGLAVALFAGLLYVADLDEFVRSVRQADRSLFVAGLLVGFISLLVWAWVWHRFFSQLGIESTVSRTVRMFLTGHFLNGVTPLGQFGGEPIMAYIVSDTTGAEYERSLAAVISSDIVNAAPFFTFPLGGIIYLAAFGRVGNFLLKLGLVTVSLLTVGSAVAYLLWSDDDRLGDSILDFLDRLQGIVGRGDTVFDSLRESVTEVADAFQQAGSDRRFLLTTGLGSHLAIIAQIASLYFVFRAIGLEPTFVPLYFLVTLSTIATLSPTPGGSGTYEAAFAALMTIFYPVSLATALTAAVLFRLTTYWPGLVVGFGAMLTLTSRADEDKRPEELQ